MDKLALYDKGECDLLPGDGDDAVDASVDPLDVAPPKRRRL